MRRVPINFILTEVKLLKDEREKHLDRLSNACVFLMRKYGVRPFPELQLSLVPLDMVKHNDGRISLLKGRYTRTTDTIEIFEGKDAVLGLMHEFHHALDARRGIVSKGTAQAPGMDPEGEAEVHKRALADLYEFRVWEIAYTLELAKQRQENAFRIRKKREGEASCSRRQ